MLVCKCETTTWTIHEMLKCNSETKEFETVFMCKCTNCDETFEITGYSFSPAFQSKNDAE